jgi:uncharacterized protein (DUF2267 family)
MSVSANRIIEIKVEESYNSFNLWHDRKLMDFLDEEANFFSRLSDDGAGVSEVSVEVLEDAVLKAVELELDADTISNLKKDIAWAKEHDQEFVQYDCY